ncbi:unnamed protein product [Moneuplotes crassus]|uniref:Regulator of telomere elongation helicase 1 homolog n=1 Tax=Euplotes crassus TaxID=5936 RepID=A0AAD1XVS8_EUPCR|nr:unnamed protein product [Moneuplotes crassus]
MDNIQYEDYEGYTKSTDPFRQDPAASAGENEGLAQELDQNSLIAVEEDLKEKHFEIDLEGSKVYFPFRPYETQEEYMNQVLTACNNQQNGLLESPTGTGKTLSLLCATLGWLKDQRDQRKHTKTRILYCSRTHSQINQVIKELKETIYRPKTVLLGSKDQMCVNSLVNSFSGSTLNSKCKSLREGKLSGMSCHAYSNTVGRKNPKGVGDEIMDIEDLHRVGKELNICPYYLQKARVENADLILMPYNYILDWKVRKQFAVYFENSVIIFDEAHNIERVCEEISSFEVTTSLINDSIFELNSIQKKVLANQENSVCTNRDIFLMRTFLADFKENFNNFDCEKDVRSESINPEITTLPGNVIFEIALPRILKISDPLEVKKTTKELYKAAQNILDEIATGDKNLSSNLVVMEDILRTVGGLYNLTQLQKEQSVEQDPDKKKDIEDYFVAIIDETTSFSSFNISKKPKSGDPGTARKLGFWCFNPGLGFQKLQGLNPVSILLTSGTLSPMECFTKELNTEFKVVIECPHVIPDRQFLVNVITKGPDTEGFNFTYKQRENREMQKDLGEALLQICQISPGGVLCFFPSYALMNKLKQSWEQERILDKINSIKKVYYEPSNSKKCRSIIRRYYKDVYNGGALLMAICRGKIAEGIDFSDDAARTVIQIGIPFPMLKEPKTILKKRYLDKASATDSTCLTGKEWYSLQATRAFNQAIGRVIRHKEDYGNIILMDERFAMSEFNQQISKWLRESIKINYSFDKFLKEVEAFFDQINELDLKPKPQIDYFDDEKITIGESSLGKGFQAEGSGPNFGGSDCPDFNIDTSLLKRRSKFKRGFTKVPQTNSKKSNPCSKFKRGGKKRDNKALAKPDKFQTQLQISQVSTDCLLEFATFMTREVYSSIELKFIKINNSKDYIPAAKEFISLIFPKDEDKVDQSSPEFYKKLTIIGEAIEYIPCSIKRDRLKVLLQEYLFPDKDFTKINSG